MVIKINLNIIYRPISKKSMIYVSSESKQPIENLEERVNELKKKRENEERKFVEKKLLQLSVLVKKIILSENH